MGLYQIAQWLDSGLVFTFVAFVSTFAFGEFVCSELSLEPRMRFRDKYYGPALILLVLVLVLEGCARFVIWAAINDEWQFFVAVCTSFALVGAGWLAKNLVVRRLNAGDF